MKPVAPVGWLMSSHLANRTASVDFDIFDNVTPIVVDCAWQHLVSGADMCAAVHVEIYRKVLKVVKYGRHAKETAS